MDDPTQQLEVFNPNTDLPSDFLVIMYGLRRSGKTVMMKHMLYEMQDRLKNTEVYVICGTLEVNPGQYDFVPKSAQFSDISNLEYRLKTIIDRQKERKRKQDEGEGGEIEKKKMYGSEDSDEEENGKTFHHESKSRVAAKREVVDPETYEDTELKPVLIILDDVVSENAVRTSPSLRLLAVGGRHLLISVIILSQVVCGSASVPPSVRTQADCIIVVAQPRSRVERELLSEQYLCASNEAHAKTFGLQLLNKATEIEHQGLVISTISPSARGYLDFCYTYGPVPFPPCPDDFKMGTEEQWLYEERMKGKKPSKKAKQLPYVFENKPDLPKHPKTGEYVRGLSNNIYW